MTISILIFVLSLFSGVWLWSGLSYISTTIGFHDLDSVNPSELGIMVISIAGPILIAVMIMILAYNHSYIKNLFTNQQAFIKLLQRKMETSEKFDDKKVNIMMMQKIDRIIEVLLLRLNEIICKVGDMPEDVSLKLWQRHSLGDKYSFLIMAMDTNNSYNILQKIEAKMIQDNDFAENIIDICNSYDNLYNLFLFHDTEEILVGYFVKNPLSKFISAVTSFKKTEEKLIEQDMYNIISDDEDKAKEDENGGLDFIEFHTPEPDIDWTHKREEMIDKYRDFAKTVKTNISKGNLDES